jgi:predicted TIM-barrel fold metal-dependent hydrolase
MEKPELVVDADGHVVELPPMWLEHLAPEFRGRAPRYTTDENGRFCLVLGDTLVARFAYDLSTHTSDDWEHAPHREGGWNPKRRLSDMDAEGIDRAVLFPSLAFFACEAKDPALDAALCRAYNDWVAGYCRAAPDRLFAVALLPLRDLPAALRELERAAGELGLRGAFVRPNPLAGRPLHHPAYEPLWECAAALDVPIAVHEGLSDTLPTLGRDRFENPVMLHVLSHPFEQMAACAGLVLSGVMERHPRLRFAFLESGSGWLPYWLERMDSHFETWRALLPAIRERPSDYFRRQCFVSCDPDDGCLRAVVEAAGDECIVWASDYPHPDAHFPGTLARTRESLSGISEASRRRILGGNALRLYGLASG